MSKDYFATKCVATIRDKTSIPNLLRSITHPEERLKWDKSEVGKIEIIDVNEDNMLLYYTRSASQYSFISARDFVEKKIVFRDGKKYYHFFTAAPDDFRPGDKDTVRGYQLVGFHIFEEQDDGTIKYESLQQFNFNAGSGFVYSIVQQAIIATIGSNMEKWFVNWIAYIKTMEPYENFI